MRYKTRYNSPHANTLGYLFEIIPYFQVQDNNKHWYYIMGHIMRQTKFKKHSFMEDYRIDPKYFTPFSTPSIQLLREYLSDKSYRPLLEVKKRGLLIENLR